MGNRRQNCLFGSFWLFMGRFLRNPRSVGAVCPSSRYLARKMLEHVDWKPGVRIVEFGAGTGPFTGEAIKRLPPESRFLAIERDPVFVDILQSRFPGLDVSQEGAEALMDLAKKREMLPVDHIISGLPFASLPTAVSHGILDATESALRPGGTFTTFQYVHALGMKPARLFRKDMQRRFGAAARSRVEFRNVPPAFVFTWKKPDADGTNGS